MLLLAVRSYVAHGAINYSLAYSQLGLAYMRSMAIDSTNTYCYMVGTVILSNPIYGQTALGGDDAILIKLYLSNASVVWVQQFGGNNQDVGALLFYTNDVSKFMGGGALNEDAKQFVSQITTYSTNVPNLPASTKGNWYQCGLAVFDTNGTLIRYDNSFSQFTYGCIAIGMQYSASLDAYITQQ